MKSQFQWEVRIIGILDLLQKCYYDGTEDSNMDEFKCIHPKQLINDRFPVPVWKIHYSYYTARGNPKIADKYLIAGIGDWDIVELEFNSYIQKENEKHPERRLSNVKILDASYMGKFYIDFEK